VPKRLTDADRALISEHLRDKGASVVPLKKRGKVQGLVSGEEDGRKRRVAELIRAGKKPLAPTKE
jgi:hypothetical protein